MFLLRNINDLNLTLAEPLYGHPVETLLLDSDDEEEHKHEEKSEEKSEEKHEENNEYTKAEITLFSLSVVFVIALLAVIIQQYSNKIVKLN
jgi:Na+/glutamate symporter